ncbi:hypothetical protein GHT06_011113 [Daphnia sinensis]|uniref:C2H2-type domain-containing protein n=1 Tax=Daphnia sinensis TaxID=1820382 RepID=A0AAD5L1P3_9CRUS|nr:hypothetical protein GHT06_011113 [Daphnia sinensis]
MPACPCECFQPGKLQLRQCQTCKHGWVPHALDKLGMRSGTLNSSPNGTGPVEPALPNTVFDVASLALYGCQALPIRLKILLDRLFSVLPPEDVVQVLTGFGWSLEDYARGYILQDAQGRPVEVWSICGRDEEPLVLQQFLRFGETRVIASRILQQHENETKTSAAAVAASSAASSGSEQRARMPTANNNNKDASSEREQQQQQLKLNSDIKEFLKKAQQNPQAALAGMLGHSGLPGFVNPLNSLSFPFIPGLTGPPGPLNHLPRLPAMMNLPPPPPPAPHQSTLPRLPTAAVQPQQHSPPVSSISNSHAALTSSNNNNNNNQAVSSTTPSSASASATVAQSPLGRLQGMQPFDFRSAVQQTAKERCSRSPESNRIRLSPPPLSSGSLNLKSLQSLTTTQHSSAVSPLCLTNKPADVHQQQQRHRSRSASSSSSELDWDEDDMMDDSDVYDSGTAAPQNALNLTRKSGAGAGGRHHGQRNRPEISDSLSEAERTMMRRPGKSGSQGGGGGGGQGGSSGGQGGSSMKRSWNPLGPLGTQLINPATGKKRVQCNVCLKTFCDKGALKIHFSAVHLREMHKCTVDGCNMMFSSRRSRNRHSANPNPKLHSPHLRRKISPHDGRTSQPHPALGSLISHVQHGGPHGPPGGFPGLAHLPPLPAGMHPQHGAGMMVPDGFGKAGNLGGGESHRERSVSSMSSSGGGNGGGMGQDGDHVIKGRNYYAASSDDLDDDLDDLSSLDEGEEGSSSAAANNRLHHVAGHESAHGTGPAGVHPQNQGMDHNNLSSSPKQQQQQQQQQQQGGQQTSGAVRKRKSQNPTRLFQQQQQVADAYLSDNDGRSDASDQSGGGSSSGRMRKKNNNNSSKTKRIKKEADFAHGGRNSPPGGYRTDEEADDDADDDGLDSKNGLPSAETATAGRQRRQHSSGPAAATDQLDAPPSNPSSAPPTPLSGTEMRDVTGMDADSIRPYPLDVDDEDDEELVDSLTGSPRSDCGSSSAAPLDKDNPRRCSACGKVFQNHFGVKTHYQNVHLKLMHRCTVDGCAAAFPSKRSRDRHAQNSNLHRKLLSTDGTSAFHGCSPLASPVASPTLAMTPTTPTTPTAKLGPTASSAGQPDGPAGVADFSLHQFSSLRDEFLSRIYANAEAHGMMHGLAPFLAGPHHHHHHHMSLNHHGNAAVAAAAVAGHHHGNNQNSFLSGLQQSAAAAAFLSAAAAASAAANANGAPANGHHHGPMNGVGLANHHHNNNQVTINGKASVRDSSASSPPHPPNSASPSPPSAASSMALRTSV